MARPKIKINYKEVEKLARLGLTDQEIADFIGVCRATISNNKVNDKKFLDIIKKGKLDSDNKVVESLYNRAIKGDTTACIFWLKNRQPKKFRDKHDIEHTGGVKIIRDSI